MMPAREGRDPTPSQMRWLYPKILLFVTGAAIGLAGMASGREWLVNAGVAVLAVGLLLRFLTRDRDDVPYEDDEA